MPGLQEGDPAPRFELRGIDNQIRSLDGRNAAATFLFFYERKLKDCRKAFAFVERLTRAVRSGGGEVWALTADGHGESLEVADNFQVSFPILLDRRGRVREAYGFGELPGFVHLDRGLLVRGRVEGMDERAVVRLGRGFATELGLDARGLFEEEDWLPGA